MTKAGRAERIAWPEHWDRERVTLAPRGAWLVEGHIVRRAGSWWLLTCPGGDEERRVGLSLRDAVPALGEHFASCKHAPSRSRTVLLPDIPAGRFRLTFRDPMFTRWEGRWCLIGPDATLPVGRIIGVTQYGSGGRSHVVQVLVGEYLAEHTVHHRPGSYTSDTRDTDRTRYVVARIDTGDTT